MGSFFLNVAHDYLQQGFSFAHLPSLQQEEHSFLQHFLHFLPQRPSKASLFAADKLLPNEIIAKANEIKKRKFFMFILFMFECF
jgi:hypothetical protein